MPKPTKGGAIIRALRQCKKMSQSSLSHNTGFALNTIQNWEYGISRPPLDDVITITEYLGFTIEAAMKLIEQNNNTSGEHHGASNQRTGKAND